MTEPSRNLLKHLGVLLNYRTAPSVLKCLKESQNLSARGMRLSEICQGIGKPSSERGHVLETLQKLHQQNLVSRGVAAERELFSISIEGLRALDEYERLESDTELEGLAPIVRELLRRHGYTVLLPAQRDFLKLHFPLRRSLIIMASPSAGKTFLAECCVFDELQKGGRILYITPYKALNRQKHQLFAKLFSEYDVVRTDGDTYLKPQRLSSARLVVATYEKALMGILRNEAWLQNISLVVADEITLLSDNERGPNLDLLLTTLVAKSKILTLSSHVGNASMLKRWLNADSFEAPPDEMTEEYVVRSMGSSARIENLTGSQKSEYPRTPLLKAIVKHSNLVNGDEKGTMIVLVGERRIAENLASDISKWCKSRKTSLNGLAAVDEETNLLRRLKTTLKRGVAFHHAGLSFDVRESIERLLDKREISVVVSTPTLSHGVDFPLDHVAVDWDSFGGDKLRKIEYVQYRGRAARIGKSRCGNVYVFSRKQEPTDDKIRRFLSKPVEDVIPPYMDSSRLEWIVLLAFQGVTKLDEDVVIRQSRETLRRLLAFSNPAFKIKNSRLNRVLKGVVRNLQLMGLVSAEGRNVAITKKGENASRIDWVPRDSYRVAKMLEGVSKLESDDIITKHLLYTASYIGLLKRFDSSRVNDIIISYLRNRSKEKKALPPKAALRGVAISSVLLQWIDEVPIDEILRASTSGDIVYDEDIRKLGTYASVEVDKIARFAEDLGYRKIGEVAKWLSIRLKRGVKEDLVSEEPATDLSRLEDIGRRKARALSDSGFRNLADIYRTIFNEGERAFIAKSKLPEELAIKVVDQLRGLVKSDSTLLELCKKL